MRGKPLGEVRAKDVITRVDGCVGAAVERERVEQRSEVFGPIGLGLLGGGTNVVDGTSEGGDVAVTVVVGPFGSADGLGDVGGRSTTEDDGFDAGLEAHEFAE